MESQLVQVEHIEHGIHTIGLANNPGCGQGGTAGKVVATGGPVCDLQAFTCAGKVYRVFPYDITAAD